jgi:hypothetical protein
MRLMTLRSLLSTLFVVSLLGIGASPVTAQTPAAPSDKLAWNQSVSSGSASSYTFLILVDGARSPLTSVTCTGDTDLSCVAPLPAMTPGRHEVRLVAVFTANGQAIESAPSDPLVLTLVVISPPSGLRLVK